MEEKHVKDIMAHVDEYNQVNAEARLCDALFILRQNHENLQRDPTGKYHKTLLVKDESGKIVGKLSVYDLIRGLVPDHARETEHSRSYSGRMSSRAARVEQEVAQTMEGYQWLHTKFFDLVVQETQKKVRDVMSSLDPLLKENDTINKAIYVIFKENIRQPAVVRDEKIVGIINIMDIFPILLEIAGDECFLPSETD
jgi:CBS domain-containing protein